MTGSLCGLTKKSENFTKHKDQIYKDMLDPKSNHNFQFCCRYIQYFINTRIDQAKRRYYENMSRKLSDKSLNPKKYWSLLKTLLNGKKISCMPPIYHNNKFKSKIKANSYFTRQCTPLVNSSRLSKWFTTHVDSVLTSIDFSFQQVSNIIKKLDPKKLNDMASVRMLKLVKDSINGPWTTIFKNCFNEKIFLNDWKKAYVVPIHKKMIRKL